MSARPACPLTPALLVGHVAVGKEGSSVAWPVATSRGVSAYSSSLRVCLLVDGRHVEDVGVGAVGWAVLDGAEERPHVEVTEDRLGADARHDLGRLGTSDDLLADLAAILAG